MGKKIKILWLLRNLGILLGLRSLRCKKFRQKILTGKVLFGGFCCVIGSAWCNLHAIHPENVTPYLGDPVPPKARILEVWVLALATKSFVKKFWILGVHLVRCCALSVHSYIVPRPGVESFVPLIGPCIDSDWVVKSLFCIQTCQLHCPPYVW
jgi:hypothetical protein